MPPNNQGHEAGATAEFSEFSSGRWIGDEIAWLRYRRSIMVIASYLDASLPEQVLDLDAGDGLRSFAIAKIGGEVAGPGWTVHAGIPLQDERQVKRQERAQDRNNLHWLSNLNLTDLTSLGEKSYDLVIVDGPFYRWYSDQDRLEIARQAWQALKPGGHIVAMFRMRVRAVASALMVPGAITSAADLMQVCQLDNLGKEPFATTDSQTQCHYVGYNEIIELLEVTGFEVREIVASDGIGSLVSEDTWRRVRGLGEEPFGYLLNLIFDLSEDISTIGLSEETMAVGRRPI